MHRMLAPKWLLTHAVVLVLVLLCLRLGWWQLDRAETGNVRSYGYALEWPTFALLVVGFWVKIVHDELRPGSRGRARGGEHQRADRRRRAADERELELAAYNCYMADLAARRRRR